MAFPRHSWHTSAATARVNRTKERLLHSELELDIERARLTTESYRLTEGEPTPIRRAKMLLHLVRQLSIGIHPDELIVGNRSLLPRMGVIAPEGAVDWIDQELETLPTRPQDRFQVKPEQIQELRAGFSYWQGKTLESAVAAGVPDEVQRAVPARAFGLNQTDHAQGHILPDVASWLRLGVQGLKERIVAARDRSDGATVGQTDFYRAALISL